MLNCRSFPDEQSRFNSFDINAGLTKLLSTVNPEGINNTDLVLWVRKSVGTRINRRVKTRARGELCVPHCTLNAKNWYLSKRGIWEDEYCDWGLAPGGLGWKSHVLGRRSARLNRASGRTSSLKRSFSKRIF